MHKLLLLFLSLTLYSDQNFNDFKQLQAKAFKSEKTSFIDFKKQEDEAFTSHIAKEKETITAYKKKVKALWPEADLENAKKHVSYSKDLKIQNVIDFEHNTIEISYQGTDKELAKKKLSAALVQALSMDSAQAFNQSSLEQNIQEISKSSKYIQTAQINEQKLLSNPVLDTRKIKLTKDNKQYKLTYSLPNNSTYKRSASYLIHAKSNAQRFKLKAHWLLAIMHTESSFNPLARSWVPAYGLMQIVPKTAGIDSYYFLYKKRRLLSASYLYNTINNIETGSAYFHILFYKYLSSISDPRSRLYCAIAGYNTGAGNVARAFVGTNNVKSASVFINKMEPERVYAYLLEHLRHDEPKEYLKRVRERSEKYKEFYHL